MLGLIETPGKLRSDGIPDRLSKAEMTALYEIHGALGAADVLTDEQLDIANVLRNMGASPDVVRHALEKRPKKVSQQGKRRPGAGAKQGRLHLPQAREG